MSIFYHRNGPNCASGPITFPKPFPSPTSHCHQDWREWVEHRARDWAQRLGKAFGNKLALNPQMVLRAFELYSSNLMEQLETLWKEEHGVSDAADE